MFRWFRRLPIFSSLVKRLFGTPKPPESSATIDVDPVRRLNALARAANWETRADPALAFRDLRLNQFHELWLTVVNTERLPARAEFTARMLKSYLPNLSIVEVTAPDGRRFVHRYVGTAVTDRLGPLTGLSLEECLPAQTLQRTLAFMNAVVESRRALRIVTRFRLNSVDFLMGEIFAAPLAEDGVTPDRLLTITYFSSGMDNTLLADLESY
jgi:hypothetical protein